MYTNVLKILKKKKHTKSHSGEPKNTAQKKKAYFKLKYAKCTTEKYEQNLQFVNSLFIYLLTVCS